MLDYKVVSLVENKLGEVQDQRERDAMIKYLIQEADFEIAYYLVCTYITKRNVMDLHKSIISNISNSKSTLDLAPRGFGKSTVGDVDYCITRILRDPNIRIMIGSKTQTQAEAFLKEVRTHFEQNEDLIRIFGDWKTSKDNVWNDREFTVNKRSIIKKEATLTALGASGAVISKHFDVIIGDDLVGLENARTEKQRSNLKEWFYSSLFPTLEPDGEIHILGTRYNPLDLYEDLITLREPPMRILFLIARQFNQILQVKELMNQGMEKNGIASKLKMQPFVVGKTIPQAKSFSREQILSYVNLCVDTEEAVKTGRLDERLAVELLITRQY